MSAKKLDLTFLDDVDDFLENDAPSERSLVLSQVQKLRHAGLTPEAKSSLKEKISLGWAEKKGTLTPERKRELWFEAWTCERSPQDMKRLSKKYNLNLTSLKSAIIDSKYVDPEVAKKLKEEWIEKYGVTYEIISPGNDMLDYYDKQNDLRPPSMKLSLPPSVIFHYRFREPNWTPKEVKAKFPHIKGNTLLPLLRIRLNWMIDVPSQRTVVHSLPEAEDFYKNVSGHKVTSGIRRLAHDGPMGWQGHLGGWIVNHLGGKKFK